MRKKGVREENIIAMFRNSKGLKNRLVDFPGDSVVKNLPANAGDMGSNPDLGRFYMLRTAKPVATLLSPSSRAQKPQQLKPECSTACALQ